MPFVTNTYVIKQPILAFLFLMRELGYTQKQAQKILDKKRLSQDNKSVHKAQRICGEVALSEFSAQDIALEPLFFNKHFCVYDKPHNLLTHPKGRFFHYSLDDALKSRFGRNANVLHRLDKETSGLVLCAINDESKLELKALMQEKHIKKSYIAIVEGHLRDEVQVNAPILTNHKSGIDLSIKSRINAKGKDSSTILTPIKYDSTTDSTLIRAIPLTGRTHQIRLHCAHIGHRILGDPLYGIDCAKARIYLENKRLSLDEYKALFGARHLCLNANMIEFSFRGEVFCFKSGIDFAEL